MRYKKLSGYYMVEAVYLIPLVLLLYLLIILSGFYLYDRCVISQDCYLLAFRAGQFTNSSENYGEIIYADMPEEMNENYIRSRFTDKSEFYPCLGEGNCEAYLQNEVITVTISGYEQLLSVNKSVAELNPFKVIRNVRRQENASKVP